MAKESASERAKAALSILDPHDILWKLEDTTRMRARGFLCVLAYNGYGLVRVSSGRRSIEVQQRLYAQGRTADELRKAGINPHIANPEADKVTWTKPADSYHVVGRAFDLWLEAYWMESWREIGRIGKLFGFEWGGDWKVRDYGHFQLVSEHGQGRLGL